MNPMALLYGGGGGVAAGNILNAIGERQGAKAAMRTRSRQIGEQRQLQDAADAQLMQDIRQVPVAAGSDVQNANYAANVPGGVALDTNVFDTNRVQSIGESLANMDTSSQLAKRNLAIAQQRAAHLAKLYDAETDVAGMKGIALRTLGKGTSALGQGAMKAGVYKLGQQPPPAPQGNLY